MDSRQLYFSRRKPFLVMMALICIAPLIFPSSYAVSLFVLIGIYSIITQGLSLLMGYAGQISLGHAAFFCIGAYTSGILTTSYGQSPWLAMAIGILATVVIAYIVGIPTLKLKEHFLALATIGFNIIVYILVNGMYEYTGGASGLSAIPKLSLFHYSFTKEIHYYYLVWGFVLLTALLSINIVQSHAGRVLRGIHDSEMATMTLGIDVAKFKLHIFVLSAAFASLAGSLYAHFMNFIAPPTFFVTTSIELLVMVIVGGAQTIWGGILGALFMTLLGEGIRAVVPLLMEAGGEVEIVVYGAVLVLSVMFMPKGLLPLLETLPRRLGKTGKSESLLGKETGVQSEQ
jgi:branched-chain amino acid transport system permease protein